MIFQMLLREISSAWARGLVERPGLPRRTRSTFTGVTTVGTRVEGF